MIKKMKNYFEKNVFLTVVLIVIFTIAACLMWKYTLQSATAVVPTINYMKECICMRQIM